MRDVRYTEVPTHTIFESEVQPGYRSDTTGYYVATDNFRDDAVSTRRETNGAHIVPTNYGAHFFNGLSTDYEYLYWNFTSKYRRRGQSRPADFTVVALHRHGCNIYSGLPQVSVGVISSAESRLRAQIRNNDWNLAQTLGEAPETIKFIIDQGRRLTDLIKAIRSANVAKILRTVSRYHVNPRDVRKAARYVRKHYRKDSSSAWLEYQFAWMPLLSDIYSACKYLSEGLATPGGFRVHSSGLDPLDPPSLKSGITGVNGYWHAKRGVECELHFSISNSSLYNLDRLGITNPLGLAWELVPMSFVVDWFLPIGNFIDGLSQPMGLTFDFGYRTLYCDWGYEIEYYFEPPIEGGKLPTFGGKLSAMLRQKYVNFPAPVPYFRGFGNLGVGQMISGLALAVR